LIQTSLCGTDKTYVCSDTWHNCMRICNLSTHPCKFWSVVLNLRYVQVCFYPLSFSNSRQTSFKHVSNKQRLPLDSHSLVVLYYNILNFYYYFYYGICYCWCRLGFVASWPGDGSFGSFSILGAFMNLYFL